MNRNHKLSPEEIQRYTRQIMLPEIGTAGQQKLAESRVLVIGAGGLGSPAAYYLAAAGVGTIGLADGDRVELSNLQRQLLHDEAHLGAEKAYSGAVRLTALNHHVQVEPHVGFLDDRNLLPLLQQYDFILDASDQIENKFLISDGCVLAGKPFSVGEIRGFDGQVMTCLPGKSPCYRCLFEELPEPEGTEKQSIGVLGMTAGVIGSIQAVEAVKYLLGVGKLLTGRMLLFSGLDMNCRTIEVGGVSKACRVCGSQGDIRDLRWYEPFRR